jgi:hypothetical protein
MDEGEEMGRSTIESGCEASEMLELVEAALNAVPQAVLVPFERKGLPAV